MSNASEAPGSDSRKGEIALRTALTIMDRWQASAGQIQKVLRVSRSTCSRVKSGAQPIRLDTDQLARISLILNVHATLRSVFVNPVNVYGFPSMKNDNEFFDGRSPLEIMSQGDFISLYETCRRIQGLCRDQTP